MGTYANQQASHKDETLILPTRGLSIKFDDIYVFVLEVFFITTPWQDDFGFCPHIRRL